jgi:hypothetical protein
MSNLKSTRHAPSAGGLRPRASALIGFAFALVLLAASGDPARAGYVQFGAEDKVTKIVDLNTRSPSGDALYLGYKLRVYSFFAPVSMADDGYVIGFSDDSTRYIPLTPEKIAAMQRQGQLPTPLPPYAISWSDRVYGYFLWIDLLGLGAVGGAIFLISAAVRPRKPAADGEAPLTVAGMAARRNRFALAGLALAVLPVVVIVWLAQGFWLTVLLGPREATAAELIAARAGGDDHEWFVLAERPRALGVNRVLTLRNAQGQVQQTQSFLYVVPGSPSILFETQSTNLKTPINAEPPYYAWISSRDPFDGTYRRAREAAAQLGYTSLASFMLIGSGGSPTVTRIATAIVAAPVAIVLVLILRGLFVTLRNLRDPLRTAGVRYLLKSSRAGEGLDQLVREIDSQAAHAGLRMNSYGSFLLPSWLIVNRLVLMSTEDVIWIVPYTVSTRQFGIKTAERHQLNVVDRFGRHILFRPTDLNAGLRQIFSRAPWAVVGPDTQMERAFGKTRRNLFAWLKGRRNRAELVRSVDARRLAILTQAKAAQAG